MKFNNYLLIGLGGTGCAVVRELKKKVYLQWRAEGHSGNYPEIFEFQENFGGDIVRSRLATLSVDSNQSDLDGEGDRDTKWRVFGQSIRLRDTEKVLINPGGTSVILEHLERHPGIEPWIRSDLDFVREIARGVTGPAGCNQIRRMGRLALANGKNMKKVVDAVQERLSQLGSGGQVGAEIHIACTLACGTGSGAIVDVLTQIQKMLKNRTEHQIFVHGFATANNVGDINTGNFYANQISALEELSALRLANYRPWDVSLGIGAQPRRLHVPKPGGSSGDLAGTFKSIALITETTEGQRPMSLDDQIETVAEFLFQIAIGQMGDIPRLMRDALTCEDRAQYPAEPPGGDRTTNFISYGVQKIAIPDREIREKLAYTFVRQFLLKGLFHNWDQQYREQPKAFAKDGFVDSRRAVWGLTRSHLNLTVVETTAGQPEFSSYEKDWTEIGNETYAEVLDQLGKEGVEGWLEEFDARMTEFERAGFRKRGLMDYFSVRNEEPEMRQRARVLRDRLEHDLLAGFERLDREYALHSLPIAIAYLRSEIEKDRLYFGELSTTTAEEIGGVMDDIEDIRAAFKRGGFFAFGKRKVLFDRYREGVIRQHLLETVVMAARYASAFCLKLIEEIAGLQDDIEMFSTRLKRIVEDVNTELTQRIPETLGQSKREEGEVYYLVDAPQINSTLQTRFERVKEVQDKQSRLIMEGLKPLRGDRYAFGAYVEKMPMSDATGVGGAFVEELRRLSEDNAEAAHRQVMQDDRRFEGIFGSNIVKKLYSEFGGKVEGPLENLLREVMGKAMPLVTFDPNQEGMALDPTGQVDGPVLRRFVFLPQCTAVPAEFQRELEEKIETIRAGGGSTLDVTPFTQPIPEDRNPSEIVIVSVAFFFPARKTKTVQGLRDLYKQRVSGDERQRRRAFFEISTETHSPRLPGLFVLDKAEVIEESRPHVLLAAALGLMHLPETGADQVYFGVKDAFGRIEDSIPSGMVCDPAVRETRDRATERHQREFPLEAICLLKKFDGEFRESAQAPLKALVHRRLVENAISPDTIGAKLDNLTGCIFLLQGQRHDDAEYCAYDRAATHAKQLVKTMSAS
jgi:hypothetical protein